jgi:hypothetical protein
MEVVHASAVLCSEGPPPSIVFTNTPAGGMTEVSSDVPVEHNPREARNGK